MMSTALALRKADRSEDIFYPDTDGEHIAEGDIQRDALVYCLEVLKHYFRAEPDVYVSGNLLFYYEEGNPCKSFAPDVFAQTAESKAQRIRNVEGLKFAGKRDREKGIALFLVLWVLTLLSVIVGEFCHTMRTEVNITRNFKEQTQAYYLASAGINAAIRELIKNTVMPKETKPSEDELQEEKIEWRANTDIPAVSFAGGTFKVEIENESGKININRAGEQLLRMMISHFDMEDSDKEMIVDSVIDWRDTDTLHRLNGAEDDYYLSLSPPYECKDADFDSVEELRQVKGITPEIFDILKEVVTVYTDQDSSSRVKDDKKQFDFNKININAAAPQVLKLVPGMSDEIIEEIIAHREKEDFNSLTELVPLLDPEIYSETAQYLSVEMSPLFTIFSIGTVEDSRTQEGVKVLIKIDTSLKKKYRILRWTDALEYSTDFQIR